MLTAAMIALLLPPLFLVLLLSYFLSTFLYSMLLKKIPVLDVFVLTAFYILRLMAGGVAVSIFPSFWLLAFSMFLFLSLGILKRYSELASVQQKGQMKKIPGRGYSTTDLETLRLMGTTSGYMSVLVVALYINSEQVKALYSHSPMLWAVCPLLLYWVSRLWLLAGRGQVQDDPLLFTLTDGISQLIGALVLICVLLSI